jgi:hypothetical protein
MRRRLILVLAGIFASMGASYRTPQGNFVVEAAQAQVAEQIGKWAEYYRKQKALEWLGHEMPRWPEPCPIRVSVTRGGPGGATSFNFMGGEVWQTMHIEGPLDRLVASVLPHEITHTVFAHYFRRPLPRWADEGGSVLSEDEIERNRHDMMVRQILNSRRAYPLGQLFSLRNYPENPRDVGALYAQGYSVSHFLVESSNRQTFLAFVAHGMQYGWDSAAQAHFRYQNVNHLEQAWKDYLIRTKNKSGVEVAQNGAAIPASRIIVRLTAPPMDPLQESLAPTIRAQAPDSELGGGWADPPQRTATSRPGYLPSYSSGNQGLESNPGWQSPSVRLGQPQFDMQSPTPRPAVSGPSPVGYSR